ncbi:hypothetical protein A7X64_08040 [Stenotrophomonas maltophilia]|nr:hypothetical protein A7X64_08040 [Stenotrophomonas maltophilia]
MISECLFQAFLDLVHDGSSCIEVHLYVLQIYVKEQMRNIEARGTISCSLSCQRVAESGRICL